MTLTEAFEGMSQEEKLDTVVMLWPNLTDAVQAAILGLVVAILSPQSVEAITRTIEALDEMEESQDPTPEL